MIDPQGYQVAPPPPQSNLYENSPSPYNVPTASSISNAQPYPTSPPPLYTPSQPPPYVSTPVPPPQGVFYSSAPVATPVAQPPPSFVVVQEQTAPPPTTVVVVENDIDSRNRTAAWVIFGLGFIFPLLWCVGPKFIRSSDPSTRLAGILSLAFLFVSIVVLFILIPLLVIGVL